MNIIKYILSGTNKIKPILLKIFPNKWLRRMKKILVKSCINDMGKNQIKPFDAKKYSMGINLIGNVKEESGLGQSCRLVADELLHSSVDFSIYNYMLLGNTKADNCNWDNKISKELPFNVNLIHINPNDIGIAFTQLPNSFFDYRYNIAFWLWELEEFPDEWIPCISCLDEIWTPSEFISNCLRKKTMIPVKTIPYSVDVTINKFYDREFFKLPQDKFLYLVMYDSNSITERKNPKGAMEAFKQAFDKNNDNVGLIIKINHAAQDDLNLIKNVMDGYNNVFIITDTLDKDQVNSLIKCSNVLVSLHRAEGFGLVLAESMLLGIPTIATNWSSNIEFMNHDVSCLVDYKLVELDKDMGPFKKGNKWADPDINIASEFMKKLYNDNVFYNDIASNAKYFIQDKLSMSRATELINQRINEINTK